MALQSDPSVQQAWAATGRQCNAWDGRMQSRARSAGGIGAGTEGVATLGRIDGAVDSAADLNHQMLTWGGCAASSSAQER